MYEAFARRKAIESITRLKEAMISGIFANSNYDPQEKGQTAPRESILREMDERFDLAVSRIRGDDKEIEIDKDDPFFSAMDIPQMDTGDSAPEIVAKREDFDYDQA